jgi:anti-sigma regulatory factor (Ser/Thr protein kinase)
MNKEAMTSSSWRVKLETPAATEFLHIVRLTTAGAAAEAGLDAEEVDDVKIAVDELCALAMAATDRDTVLTIEFVAVDGELVVEGDTGTGLELDEMGRAILGATVDELELTDTTGGGGFRLTKKRRVG